jgi:ATP-dependent Lhr-like helicase
MVPGITGAFYREMENVDVGPLFDTGPTAGPVAAEVLPQEDDENDEQLVSFLSEWLQFYGPITANFIRASLGLNEQRLLLVLDDLVASQGVISGQLVTDGDEDEICDAENFEIMLRLSRREALPAVEPQAIAYLSLLLAHHQGLAHPEGDIDGLSRRLEQLLCFHGRAGLWESEILPARMRAYDPSWLDTIMQEGDLRWIGSGNHRISFCFEPDLDLLREDYRGGKASDKPDAQENETLENADSAADDLFPDAMGRYDFSALLQVTKLGSSELTDRLWEEVWRGHITNDTFIALRKGIESRFKLSATVAADASQKRPGRRSSGRARFGRWKGALPFAGNWFRLKAPEISEDLLEMEERNKDRVRLLLDRYGILFRELLLRELLPFQWSSLFRSLRLMELSGEVLAGYFFHGIPGPQFISHQAFGLFQRGLPEDSIYWLNAVDPASLCGMPLDAVRGKLPRRLDHTHLVYRGRVLVMTSERHGRTLTFHVPHDDPDLQSYLGPLHHLLTRSFRPLRRITIETINGAAAYRSPYVDALRVSFEVVIDPKQVTLYRHARSWVGR